MLPWKHNTEGQPDGSVKNMGVCCVYVFMCMYDVCRWMSECVHVCAGG